MKARSDLWCMSFMSLLGLFPAACGGKSSSDASGRSGAAAPGGTSGSATLGGSAGAGGSATSGSGGGTTAPSAVECVNPTPDAGDGVVYCDNRAPYRVQVGEGCHYTPPAGGNGGTGGQGEISDYSGQGGIGEPRCAPDQCTERPRGFCMRAGPTEPTCIYGCTTDADCTEQELCLCSSPSVGGLCVPASCRSDADCDERRHCSMAYPTCGGGRFLCESALDECLTHGDCDGGLCRLADDGARRVCSNSICGRPFLVDDQPRVAALTRGEGWRDRQQAPPDLGGLSARERRLLADHYASLGQLEQASIAAFARFALQLLALGAPSGLVLSCSDAMLDETRHARACFELASRYAGESIAPAELSVADCLGRTDLAEVLRLVIAEGCVGETQAALEAAEAATHATDPAVRAVLLGISADETRHAALAWRFARWALEQGGPELEAVARGAFAASRNETPSAAPAADARLQAHGLLSMAERCDVHRHALCDVIAPCAEALFNSVRAAA